MSSSDSEHSNSSDSLTKNENTYRRYSKLPIEQRRNCNNTDEKIKQMEKSIVDLENQMKYTKGTVTELQKITNFNKY